MNAYPVLTGRLYQRGRHRRLDKPTLAKDLGLSYVITLRGGADKEWVGCSGVTYLHWPLKDSKSAPYWLTAAAAWLAGEMRRGKTVLVYCSGRTRGGMLTTMIVRHYLNCSGEAALEYVRAGWPKAVKPQMRPYLEKLA